MVVFEINTASDISKLSNIWIILKYHEPVLLPNSTLRLCYYYYFIIEDDKFSVTHIRPLFRLGGKKKKQASAFVTISLCQ